MTNMDEISKDLLKKYEDKGGAATAVLASGRL